MKEYSLKSRDIGLLWCFKLSFCTTRFGRPSMLGKHPLAPRFLTSS